MATAYGSQISTSSGNWWRAICEVTTNWEQDTAIAYHCKLRVETRWSFDVYANGRCWASKTSGVNDGVTSASFSGSLRQGSTGVGATVTYAEFDVQYAKSYTSAQSVTFTAQFNVTGGYGNGTSTATVTVTIPQALGASEPTLSGGPFYMGSPITINTNRKSSNFTHTLTYSFNGHTGTIASNVGASTKWTPALATFAPWLTNATQSTLTITCVTYNGSQNIGSKSVTTSLLVPDSVVPSISSASFTDAAGFLSTYGVFIQNQSDVRAAISASGSYGSSITRYYVSLGNYYSGALTSGSVTVGSISSSGSLTATITVTDSRGRQATTTRQLTFAAYSSPSLAVTAYRYNTTTGAEDDESETVRIRVTGSTTNVNNKGTNTATVVVRHRRSGTESWTTDNSASRGISWDFTLNVSGIDDLYSYEFMVTATDAVGVQSTHTVIIDTANPVIDIKGDGTGVAFGKVASHSREVETGWKLRPSGGMAFIGTIGDADGTGLEWLHIGTYNSGDVSPSPCVIDIYGGNGWNSAGNSQNSHVEIYIKDSYNPDGYFGVLATLRNCTSDEVTVKVLATSYSECEVWVRFTWAFETAAYTVTHSGTWTPGPYTVQTSEPVGGTACVTYYDRLMSVDEIYPVGSIVLRYDHTSPASLYGGSWTRISGCFLYATGSTGTIGATGGSGTHTLTVAQMPSHNHQIIIPVSTSWVASGGAAFALESHQTGTIDNNGSDGRYVRYTGGGQAHNNNPYFINVSVWRRTA